MHCKRCGRQISENSKICSNCGLNLETESEQEQQSVTETDQKMDQKNRRKIPAAVAVTAVLLIGIVLYVSGCSRYDRTSASNLNDSSDEYLSESNHEETVVEAGSEALIENPKEIDFEASIEYLAEIETKLAEKMKGITEAIQDEENPEDKNVTAETESETVTDEALESNTATGTEEETVTVTNGAGEAELFAAVPAFNFSNISIMGYDFLKPHIGEVAAALGHSNGTEELPGGGRIYVNDDNIALDALSDDQSYYSSVFIYSHDYFEREYSYLQIRNLNGKKTYVSQLGESWCSIPILLGDSYGRWCEQIGLNTLKGSPLVYYEKYDWASDSDSYSYNFQPEDRNARINYTEHRYRNTAWRGDWYAYDMQVDFFIQREDGRAFRMTAFFLNETIQDITYYVYP